MNAITDSDRRIGLFAATGVGVGAIVGGGILALAGVAFAVTGPAAILAFALNGVIAMLTALSFAEMASKFPESGGTYTFCRKVLSVEAAFTVGWVVWFASIVAAALYAIGFGYFALVLTTDTLTAVGWNAPTWLEGPSAESWVAFGAVVMLTLSLLLKASGGGQWANVGKVLVFGILIAGGIWAIARQSPAQSAQALRPFFSAGVVGLIQAMGYSFIALQGFDLIAAVGGEIRNPAKNIPRAMILSLVIALIIYIPLLLIIATVGISDGRTVAEVAAEDPEGIVAVAANQFLGPTGYWLVVIAALLSMFTALQANLFAASRIAMAMSRDRTLPSVLSRVSANRRTPGPAITTTAALVSLLIWLLTDVAVAGAAASLIFLVTFAIAHWLAVLVRQRSMHDPPPFRSPMFPFVPVVGGAACIALAVYQGIAVPSAGVITIVWLSIGGILFLSLFAKRARLLDVSSVAADPELVRLRGNTPLVLVPIANPHNAPAMITLADTLVPRGVGRVLLHNVVVADSQWDPDADSGPVDQSQTVLRELLRVSAKLGVRVETLATVAPKPMEEIARVAELHRCESVLLGLSDINDRSQHAALERLLSRLNTDVVVLRAPLDWQPTGDEDILVPVAGRGGHDYLLARLLGSLSRQQKQRKVTFLRVVPTSTSPSELKRIKRDLDRMAYDNVGSECERDVVLHDDPVALIAQRADQSGLTILGVQRIGPHQKMFGGFTSQIASRTHCPIVVISRRG